MLRIELLNGRWLFLLNITFLDKKKTFYVLQLNYMLVYYFEMNELKLRFLLIEHIFDLSLKSSEPNRNRDDAKITYGVTELSFKANQVCFYSHGQSCPMVKPVFFIV